MTHTLSDEASSELVAIFRGPNYISRNTRSGVIFLPMFLHPPYFPGICVAKSLEIPREPTNDTFSDIITVLADNGKAKVVVLFVNEDNCQKLVKASLEKGHNNDLYWLASDSWGAKEVPVRGQELAAEGTVTILPQREVVKGQPIRGPKLDRSKYSPMSMRLARMIRSGPNGPVLTIWHNISEWR